MVNLVLSQTLQSSCQCCCCCFANSFFSSVSRESWWRCWSLQSWTKVLGTVLQYSYFSVISRFPLKTVHHFGNFLAVLPPFTLAIQSWNSKKILDTRPTLFVGVRGGVGLVWIGKRPTNAKVSQDFCPWLYVSEVLHHLQCCRDGDAWHTADVLAKKCWSFWDWWWHQTPYKFVQRSFKHPARQADCGGLAPYWPGLPRLRRAVAVRWDTMIPPTVGDSPYHLDLHQLVWAYNS